MGKPKKEKKLVVRSKWKWWGRKRAVYNLSVLVTGLIAYLAIILPRENEPVNRITVSDVSFSVHLMAYLVFLVAINIFFFTGLLIDHLFNKHDSEKFQLWTFYALMLVTLPLPFIIPLYFPHLIDLTFNILFGVFVQIG